METPPHYADVSKKALDVRDQYGLTDTQTLLYNHICRRDFYLRNEDGQSLFDEDHNGFGWGGSRDWVKKQFKPLIKAGLVKFESRKDCRGAKYTSWYFYDSSCVLEELVHGADHVSTEQFLFVKEGLGLPDGFDRKNGKYGDIEFMFDEKQGYTFSYKGEDNNIAWKWREEGKIQLRYKFIKYYKFYDELINDLLNYLTRDGHGSWADDKPDYSYERRFKL